MGAEKQLEVHVLFRGSKKTGKVDTVMTGIGTVLMKLWALQNTTSSKESLIFHRDSGKLVYHVEGNKKNGFPAVVKYTEEISCEDFGFPLEYLQAITDDRFDKEEN